MKREIIHIDEDLCTGCGDCVPNCHEGALQIIDGKARLISDLFCDGLGACIGHCPENAITVIEREAEAYDERKVMAEIVKKGENTIRAHVNHLKDHNAIEFLTEALDYLNENGIEIDLSKKEESASCDSGGCPGSKSISFAKKETDDSDNSGTRPSQLQQWPVQMHLISPQAPFFKGSDLLLAADCTAFTVGDFHKDFLKDKTLAIACPKLDTRQENYLEKLKALIDLSEINTLTVMVMQVPCCNGLLYMAQQAVTEATRKIPLKVIVIGLQGEVLKEEWI
ncbi:MAG: 4Fe-4S binding protein [Melioribacteraceae bacterium]|nr:4Fe-4S binding protein [Melioribacteraceae bacterium]